MKKNCESTTGREAVKAATEWHRAKAAAKRVVDDHTDPDLAHWSGPEITTMLLARLVAELTQIRKAVEQPPAEEFEMVSKELRAINRTLASGFKETNQQLDRLAYFASHLAPKTY